MSCLQPPVLRTAIHTRVHTGPHIRSKQLERATLTRAGAIHTVRQHRICCEELFPRGHKRGPLFPATNLLVDTFLLITRCLTWPWAEGSVDGVIHEMIDIGDEKAY